MKRLVVFGGSGQIGRGVLEAANADVGLVETRALQRRPVDPPLPRVTDVRVENFADLSAYRAALTDVDACIFALGVSQTEVDPVQYRHITIDLPLEASRRLAAASPRALFVFVSGQGADPSGRSRILFARTKGEAETQLRKERGDRLVVARPAGIIPVGSPRQPIYKLVVPVLRVLEPIAPAMVIRARDLGRALIAAAFDESVASLLENRDLRRLAGASR
jgi:uncharacterized protein YbjT (DUF2867 family)